MKETTNYKLRKPEGNDNVSIETINDNMDIIDEELKAHADHEDNTANPHKVTASQVGLGNVPNVATNDQTPTYSDTTTLTPLVSGEKLSVAMSKIAKAVSDLISHLANKSNPHGVTASQVGAAAASHNHSADNITSGTLPVTRGGTGVTANPSMLTNLGSTTAASVFAASPRPGVTGTLPVANGGTGAATLTSGAALIGNGTGAVTTRAITNNTSAATALTASTNLVTMNTLRYALNRTTGPTAADTNYTTYMMRAIALVTSVPSSMANGTCAFVY